MPLCPAVLCALSSSCCLFDVSSDKSNDVCKRTTGQDSMARWHARRSLIIGAEGEICPLRYWPSDMQAERAYMDRISEEIISKNSWPRGNRWRDNVVASETWLFGFESSVKENGRQKDEKVAAALVARSRIAADSLRIKLSMLSMSTAYMLKYGP